jgi:hypothetical protein
MDNIPVALRLAGHAGADPRQDLATTGRDSFTTLFAMIESLTRWHACAGAANRVVHGIVDLILYSTVARPTASHVSFLAPPREVRLGYQLTWVQSIAFPRRQKPARDELAVLRGPR